MNDLSCGMRMRAQVSFILSQNPHIDRQRDGRTDRWTERSWQYHMLLCIQSNDKNIQLNKRSVKNKLTVGMVAGTASKSFHWHFNEHAECDTIKKINAI